MIALDIGFNTLDIPIPCFYPNDLDNQNSNYEQSKRISHFEMSSLDL